MTPFDFQDSEIGDGMLGRVFDRLRDVLRSLANAVTNDRLIRVTFTAGTTDTAVRHALGAPVLTWEIVDRSANAVVWQSSTVNSSPRDVLILQASAPVTVLVRVT